MKSQTLSVVLPCYNEIKNIDYLIEKFQLADIDSIIAKIIFVDDDSPDGTAEYLKKVSSNKFDVVCLHRIHRHGLSSAVVEGTLLASTPYVAVMDADGQHDPGDLISMYQLMQKNHIDFIIGSRFLENAVIEKHIGFRSTLTHIGNLIANKILNRKLTDPLTGFFIFDRNMMMESIRNIRPSGFKILLDFLYQLRNKKISIDEYPINFKVRNEGESKLDSRALIEFADQIFGFLTNGLLPEKMFSFILVGSIGLLLHLTLLYIFLFPIQISFYTAQIFATFISMISNFTLNNELTFRRNKLRGINWIKGLITFILICSIGAFANVGVAGFLFNEGKTWWISAVTGIIIGTVFNFSLSKYLVWKK